MRKKRLARGARLAFMVRQRIVVGLADDLQIVVRAVGAHLLQQVTELGDGEDVGRDLGTRNLCAARAACGSKPKALLAASAVGFYGSHADELLTEASANGKGFLADLAWDWEAATEPARRAGIRVVNLRTAIVLARAGGALAMMLPIFKLGLGGKIGSGKQWMSWIAIEDDVAAIPL